MFLYWTSMAFKRRTVCRPFDLFVEICVSKSSTFSSISLIRPSGKNVSLNHGPSLRTDRTVRWALTKLETNLVYQVFHWYFDQAGQLRRWIHSLIYYFNGQILVTWVNEVNKGQLIFNQTWSSLWFFYSHSFSIILSQKWVWNDTIYKYVWNLEAHNLSRKLGERKLKSHP